MAWNPRRVDITCIFESPQCIFALVQNMETGERSYLAAIYGFNTVELRKDLWDFISMICNQFTDPICFCGDFNSVLLLDDRKNGNPVTNVEVQDFENCIRNNALVEVRSIGGYYTWCNNQENTGRILSKIDRCLATLSWKLRYPNVIAEVLGRGVSDHCPILVDLHADMVQKHSPFKFLNVLADHPSFLDIVAGVWKFKQHSTPLLDIWYKLKHLKAPMKDLNTQQFKGVAERIDDIRVNLAEVQKLLAQNQMDIHLLASEKTLLVDLEKWSGIEERIWDQKSRVTWINLGDTNTRFFHAFTKDRLNHNTIKSLITEEGIRIQTHQELKNEVVKFYKTLMGSASDSLPLVDKTIIERGDVLSEIQRHRFVFLLRVRKSNQLFSVWRTRKLLVLTVLMSFFLRKHGQLLVLQWSVLFKTSSYMVKCLLR